MKPADFCEHPSKWFGGADSSCQVVISSRVRLARNIAGYEFLPCLSSERRRELLEKLRDVMLSIKLDEPVSFLDIDQTPDIERQLLAERHLISQQHVRGNGPRGAVIAAGESFTAMINEEDHLRMQVYGAGLKIEECWRRIDHIDDLVEQKIEYAFSARFGYLTACPTNLGTGIRVSVMLHLPALKMTGQIEKLLNTARDADLTVRGLFGEGTDAVGDFYQLSNQITLGKTEQQIVDSFAKEAAPRIVAYETAARQAMLENRPCALDDKVQRALGVLRNACLISSQEALFLLSQVRLGINLGRISNISIATVNELFMLTQPAHLQLRAGKTLDADQRDTLRAQVIRQKLANN